MFALLCVFNEGEAGGVEARCPLSMCLHLRCGATKLLKHYTARQSSFTSRHLFSLQPFTASTGRKDQCNVNVPQRFSIVANRRC